MPWTKEGSLAPTSGEYVSGGYVDEDYIDQFESSASTTNAWTKQAEEAPSWL